MVPGVSLSASCFGVSSLARQVASPGRRSGGVRVAPPGRRGHGRWSLANGYSVSDFHNKELAPNKHKENMDSLRMMLMKEDDIMNKMITIDSLKRLCIDYHFSEEIGILLRSFYHSQGISRDSHFSMFDVSLSFILLREGGYDVSSDIFQKFIRKNGEFGMSVSSDIKGLLNLYDASHLNMGGEEILYKAHEFTSKQLKSSLNYLKPSMANCVREAVNHPYHLSLQRYKVKRHLTYVQRMFGRNNGMDVMEELVLTECRHNAIQCEFELMQFTRWWRELGLAQELPFARDQTHRWYMWAMAILQDRPEFSKYRLAIAKVISFIYLVDDIFDLSGSHMLELEELSMFTDVVKRWDIENVHSLPSCMRSSYLALYNVTANLAELVEKEHGYNPTHYLRKAWAKLFDAFMVEAKWFRAHQIPSAAEYLRNGVISSGVHVVLTHAFFLLGQGVTKDAADLLELSPPVITSTAKILRLWDDLGSASDEGQCGFDGSYKDCYIKENPSCSSEDLNQHIMHLISEAREELNDERFSKRSFSPSFQEVSLNLARMVPVMYTYDHKQRLPILEEYTSILL